MDQFYITDADYKNTAATRIGKAHKLGEYVVSQEFGELAVTECGRNIRVPDYFAEVPTDALCHKCFPTAA